VSRYLFFAPHYAPEPVGNAPYNTAYAEALADAGHAVTVLATYPHYPDWSSEARRFRYTTRREGSLRLVRVPHAVPATPDAIGRLRLEASYGAASLAAAAALGRFDAVLGMMPLLSSAVAARITATTLRLPCGLMIQDLMGAAAAQGGVPGANRVVAQATSVVERRALKGADVAAVALGFIPTIEGAGAKTCRFLPNFANVAPVNADRDATRRRLGLAPDEFVVTYSGNLGFKQDFDTVLAAAALLRDRPRVKFLVVGEGSQRQLIESTTEREGLPIALQPLQPADEVANVLHASDLLLAPQRSTQVDMSIPSKLTAYMSSGRAVLVVASGASETARIVEDAGAGIVTAPGDGSLLANAITKLMDDPTTREGMGAAGAAYARRQFDRDAALARFVEWTEEVRG
jgi:glycosyltransferase involved in cell wall biosynthesis